MAGVSDVPPPPVEPDADASDAEWQAYTQASLDHERRYGGSGRLLGGWLVVAGLIGLYAACALTLDKISYWQQIAQGHTPTLSCAINTVVNCGNVINTPQAAAVGFAFGSNVRAMLNDHFGIDSAVFVTPLPYRQFEFRAALVLRWWSIFEAQLGWRFQALEASQAGNVVTLFSTAPSINGPMAAVGLTF